MTITDPHYTRSRPKTGRTTASRPDGAGRVQFWGLPGLFSASALATLLAVGITPHLVVVPDRLPGRSITRLSPATQMALPIHDPAGSPDLHRLAAQHHIPVYAVSDLQHPNTAETLATLRPDIAIVACFDRRIPTHILAIPPLGFLNIHPSLLPAYRGPAPLFWLFRDAATKAMGVTVHQMDAGLDTGDILAQQPLSFPDGISGREADRMCARAGATLIAEKWSAWRQGSITTRKQPAGGSTQSWPTPADFTLDTAWPARRAFNFMRATAEWQQPYPVYVSGRWLSLRRALAYTPAPARQALAQEGNTVEIRFRPGILRATGD